MVSEQPEVRQEKERKRKDKAERQADVEPYLASPAAPWLPKEPGEPGQHQMQDLSPATALAQSGIPSPFGGCGSCSNLPAFEGLWHWQNKQWDSLAGVH